MDSWDVRVKKNFVCESPIFIEGLPGIGNVGKIAVDYIIDQLKAKPVASFFSRNLPNSVFVNEKNLVQLPAIELFHVKIGKQDYLFLSGDTQPSDEVASYLLTEAILELLQQYNVKEIVTTGGIGLEELPEKQTVFVTGNKKTFTTEFVKNGADKNIYGVVGPIVGVSGLLLGLAKKIPAAALLVETFAHPMYVGLQEARELILLIKKHYGLKVSLKELDKEIESIEEELNGQHQPSKKSKYGKPVTYSKDINYIG